jgi:transposase
LYLFPQFFKDKATEHLLGDGIEPKHLNDDKIGRVMDNPHFSQRKRMECLKALPSIDLNPILAQLPQRQCVVRI